MQKCPFLNQRKINKRSLSFFDLNFLWGFGWKIECFIFYKVQISWTPKLVIRDTMGKNSPLVLLQKM